MKHTFKPGTGLLASQHTPEEMKEAHQLLEDGGQRMFLPTRQRNWHILIGSNLYFEENTWIFFEEQHPITHPITISELKEMLKPDEKLYTKKDLVGLENIEQSLTEVLADFLDSEYIIGQQAMYQFSDPVKRELSELHIRMAKAAMNEYKKTVVTAENGVNKKE